MMSILFWRLLRPSILSGAVRCETCAAKIIAIAPLVPIVPELLKEVHR